LLKFEVLNFVLVILGMEDQYTEIKVEKGPVSEIIKKVVFLASISLKFIKIKLKRASNFKK
jgi:hypothetical protein